MYFPDQSHINRVRDALWRGANGASVMGGSGFSKNAEVKLAGRFRLPDWDGLARTMHRELHPKAPRGGRTDVPGLADPLAIAQDYCDEFGRAELHRFLRDQVRNSDIEPGEFHRRLQMPQQAPSRMAWGRARIEPESAGIGFAFMGLGWAG